MHYEIEFYYNPWCNSMFIYTKKVSIIAKMMNVI